MARTVELFRFRTPPSVCSYLPYETSSLEYRVCDTIAPEAYEAMLERGWRRHGQYIFRPACPTCRECRSLRVDVDSFQPTKSQRRALRQNHDVQLQVTSPDVTPQHVQLYNAWHRDMHARRGWRLDQTTIEQYAAAFLAGRWAFAREFRYLRGGQLSGVSLVDATPNALSSVYFYHDPAWRPLAPGTFSILKEVEYARQTGRRWLYLGYWIAACQSMAYKANFGPHEVLQESCDGEELPVWL